MNYNGQFQVEQFTVLARTSCACCDGTVQIKANKNGTAYYNCSGADDQGTPCSHQQRWGQRVSWHLRKAFRENGEQPLKVRLPLMVGGKAPVAANENRPIAANENAKPQKQAVQSVGGLFG